MMHSGLQHKNGFEHGDISQTDSLHDSNVNYALIAIAQEVAELLKQSYSAQADDEIDSIELIVGSNFADDNQRLR
ncbi:hypothetical protein IQ265_25730 [Nodosilinea sp. LEGE 06152]|uniref:hypothetical protein n=1 Tax=Nodosilinea sp. LEGE 06152 TaxID=2777966 RepID=UPI00187FC1BC|nr:hypothetical protein [Nodosilinea sp. LEGE 06152]MBE9160196.1 hypothetical protein [Nodosilinea sp. LEGE 06152]